jgi:hypothetical protein
MGVSSVTKLSDQIDESLTIGTIDLVLTRCAFCCYN